MNRNSSLLALSLMLAAGTALAAAPQTTTSKPAATQPMDHSKMDMSGKKPADHQQMANDEFAALDKNKDGKLSAVEIPAKHPMAAHFGMLDTNEDGNLSKAEFAKQHGM